MSYTIQTNAPFFPEVNRVADSQACQGLESIASGQDTEETIHDLRKRCKKIRAAWRLVRDDLGKRDYQRRNRYYRDTARILSDLRDATAILEALDLLEEQYCEVVYQSAFQELRTALEKRRDQHLASVEGAPQAIRRVRKRLEKGIDQINPIELAFEDWTGTTASVRRTYDCAYTCYRQMLKRPSPELMHEWRKRTKYLRYQLRMLKQVWRPLFKPWYRELNRLSDLQGDHHDLHVFKQVLESLPSVSKNTRRTLSALANQHQAYCYSQAMPLGASLYAESPKAFGKRLYAYLVVWGVEEKNRRQVVTQPGH